MPLLPYVRRELFLQAIKNRDASALPDPNNREELFLKAIADEVAQIPSGVYVVLPAAVSEMLTNLPEAHTHTERFYRDIIDAMLIATTVTDTTPYISRETAGGLPVSGTANLKKKLGNTVAVNQLVNAPASGSGTTSGVSVSWNNGKVTLGATATSTAYITLKTGIPTVSGHKLLVMGLATAVTGVSLYDDSSPRQFNAVTTRTIFTASGANIAFKVRVESGTSPNCVVYPLIIDLTLWFGSNDRIPADLLSHPENWGRYYAGSLDYNAGYLDSADGRVLTSIGRNVWDEVWDAGAYGSNTGLLISVADYVRNVNPVPVIPSTSYHWLNPGGDRMVLYYDINGDYLGYLAGSDVFTTPSDCHYINFYVASASYANDITISLYYSGESGYDQYYPYSVLAEVDTGSEVLRSAGSVADEKTPDGTITRNVGAPVTLDLSTMTFTQEAGGGTKRWYSTNQPFASYKKPATNTDRANAQSSQFACLAYQDLDSNSGFGITATGRLGISNDVYTNRAAYTSVEFFCEAATPATEQGTAFDPMYGVEYGGTESWTNLKGIPQGHETEYTEYTT